MRNIVPRLSLTLVCFASTATAQVISQSQLTFADVDTTFKLTLEHLGQSTRWMGVPPRQIRWAPDGRWIYFRWRADPKPDQRPATDPWYAAAADGKTVRVVPDDEASRIPSSDIAWSGGHRVAAWSSDGTLFVWTRGTGTRAVYVQSRNLGNVSVSNDGSKVFFATTGTGSSSPERSDSTQSGDLWVYDVEAHQSRQVAVARTKRDNDPKTDAGKWLRDQQLELIDIVEKRKRDREISDSVSRARGPTGPQSIPVEQEARVTNLRLSPDGRFITFRWSKGARPEHQTKYMEFVNESGYATQRDARPKVGEPLPDYKMGIVRIDPSIHQDSVEVVWVDDGTDKKTIMHGPYWSPTGAHAVLQILSIDHKDRWISFLDIETGTTTVLDHQHEDAWIGGPLISGRWASGYLEWLPDGSAFAFASTATGWAMLYLADTAGNVNALTSGQWEVRDAALSPDGKAWYLTTSKEHPGERHLYHLPARGGELKRVTSGEGVHRSYFSPDGRRVAVTYETSRMMPDLYVATNRPNTRKLRVTKSGTDDYYRNAWIGSEIISFPDAEGAPTWARVYNPPPNANGAAVIYAHGCGECAQGVQRGWVRIGAMLYANYLYHLGYTGASIDYRGSSGYGHRNRTYAYRGMGIRDIDSGLPLLDILAARYHVDRNRIGVWGGSYGGFYVLMSLLRHPGSYAAGVAVYPVTDWAHYNDGYTSRILNGAPYEDEEAYRISSPIYYAEGLQDALQIQHGLVDGNVQIQDVFRLTQRFLELEKDFDLVVYPMEDHGWDEVPSRRDSYKRMTRWFDRHLLGETRGAASGGKGSQ